MMYERRRNMDEGHGRGSIKAKVDQSFEDGSATSVLLRQRERDGLSGQNVSQPLSERRHYYRLPLWTLSVYVFSDWIAIETVCTMLSSDVLAISRLLSCRGNLVYKILSHVPLCQSFQKD
ncbi:unnamed protein product [Strongylus vulgaris]|uniref:Uncharacterized protein n=1 Tax=Strongylus vulgaris TaxID=40348 RepID=A0A3P7IRJ2_STRVU|nr:unnamed protein product [Strongylus vulgaris]